MQLKLSFNIVGDTGLTEFGVTQGSDHGEEAGHDPDAQAETDGTTLSQHTLGRHEDAGADDHPYDDGDAVQESEFLLELDAGVGRGRGRLESLQLGGGHLVLARHGRGLRLRRGRRTHRRHGEEGGRAKLALFVSEKPEVIT